MFCKNCGAKVEDNAVACQSCNARTDAAPPAGAPKPQVTTYLLPAILVTLLCCIPFGIVAIVYAAQVSTKVAAGDIQGAMDSSGKAKMWCWIGFAIGLAFSILFSLSSLAQLPEMMQTIQQSR